MKFSLMGMCLCLSVLVAAPALASGPLNILTVGANAGHRATENRVPFDPSPFGGYDHLGSTVDHVSHTTFNTMSTGDLAVYDVVLTQWATSGALNLSSAAVIAYVAGGGSLFLDGDYANYNDLGWVGITGALSYCSGPWTLDASAVPGGDVLEDSLPTVPNLVNCHGQFPNYDASVFTPFMWDWYGNVAALAGLYGSGRIIVTGPDQDYHATPSWTQQYQLLLNELEWTGNGCDDSDEDGVCDEDDNCPDVANEDQLDSDADGAGDVCDICPFDADDDEDGDGVCGDVDLCDGTVDDNPSKGLNPNQWAVIGGVWTVGAPNGPGLSFDMDATGGCSCTQIVDSCGYGNGHLKKGCSPGVTSLWADGVAGGALFCE